MFSSFCSSYQQLLQTPLTLIGLNSAQSQTSLLVFPSRVPKTINKSQVRLSLYGGFLLYFFKKAKT